MKKIVSLLIALLLVVTALAACANKEKTYTVAIAVDSAVSAKNKVTNTALVLVLDDAGKIVAARFDSSEATPELNEDNTVKTMDSVATKVEKGDAYTGMPAGSWAKQAKAYEDYIVGKTPAEVAALDTSLIAGCTMESSVATFQALVAKAAASTQKVTFKTSEAITAGVAISTAVTANKVTADFAGIVMAGGKVVASMIDSMEGKYTLAIGEDQKLTVTLSSYPGTKNEQGDAYNMVTYGGAIAEWYVQAQTYANTTVGKTVAELADLAVEGVAGCTMGVDGYKAALVRAAGYVR